MRLFLALPLPQQIEKELIQIQNQLIEKRGNVKWVRLENIHLTVRFFGETNEKLVSPLREEINTIAASYQPIETSLVSLGAFPNLNRPRVIWAGLSGGVDILNLLAEKIEAAAQRLGFEPEKKRFKAHLTLGRVRNSRDLDDLTTFMNSFKVNETPFRFEQLVLFKSTLTTKGPIYDRLHEAPLGTARFDS